MSHHDFGGWEVGEETGAHRLTSDVHYVLVLICMFLLNMQRNYDFCFTEVNLPRVK